MPEDAKPSAPGKIAFEYLKSNDFRVVHADGAYVTARPPLGLTVTFFSDRLPIPRRVVHSVDAQGNIGEELLEQRVIREAIIRDAQVTVNMGIQQVKGLIDVLQNVIQAVESPTSVQQDK